MSRYKKKHRQQFTDIERGYYHRLQDEAGCHIRYRDFYLGYRLLRALETAPVVEI